ncbi:conserved hypothetical protein [Candidatus Nitrosotenuis uzonensis]|uniref:DUF4145 domain-containing protein n=2 Tax=Candidatus Nitrosotenuis uzonensis TaxID=1407055 RepID=A0A812F2A3_9ARCH|nr:conserved hypothetical protein [Candidatus Nitrosotenuis uzonensis]
MVMQFSSQNLKEILNTTNERDLYIVGHMYIENMLDRILETKFRIPSKALDSTLFTTNLKMDILEEAGLIKGKVKKNVELLSRIRNRYAHKLAPNEQRICNYIRELDLLGVTVNTSKKYEKYRICVIRTVSALNRILTS